MTTSIRRHYSVQIEHGTITVQSTEGGVYVRNAAAWTTGMHLNGDIEARNLLEALQDYLIARHELEQEHGP